LRCARLCRHVSNLTEFSLYETAAHVSKGGGGWSLELGEGENGTKKERLSYYESMETCRLHLRSEVGLLW